MILVMVLFIIAYSIVGIGYAKLLNALPNGIEGEFMFIALAAILWPIGLTISAFWNFK